MCKLSTQCKHSNFRTKCIDLLGLKYIQTQQSRVAGTDHCECELLEWAVYGTANFFQEKGME